MREVKSPHCKGLDNLALDYPKRLSINASQAKWIGTQTGLPSRKTWKHQGKRNRSIPPTLATRNGLFAVNA